MTRGEVLARRRPVRGPERLREQERWTRERWDTPSRCTVPRPLGRFRCRCPLVSPERAPRSRQRWQEERLVRALALWRKCYGSSGDESGGMGRTFSRRLDWTWWGFVSDIEEGVGGRGRRCAESLEKSAWQRVGYLRSDGRRVNEPMRACRCSSSSTSRKAGSLDMAELGRCAESGSNVQLLVACGSVDTVSTGTRQCLRLLVYASWSSFHTTDPTNHTPILPMYVSYRYGDNPLNRTR